MRDNFVIKLSREGDNVQRAQDFRLLFNSGWPVPKLIGQGLIPAGTSDSLAEDIPIFEHNLGYRPMYLLWQDAVASDVRGHTTPPISHTVNDASELAGSLYMDEQKFFLRKAPYSITTSTYNYYYAILDVNLQEEFNAGSDNPGRQGDMNPVSKEDLTFKVFNDTIYPKSDTRSRPLDSAFQPLLIHSISHRSKANNDFETINVEHNLGYPPAFFVFGYAGDPYPGYRLFEFAPESSIGASASVSNTDFNMGITLPFEAAIVLLKDPIA